MTTLKTTFGGWAMALLLVHGLGCKEPEPAAPPAELAPAPTPPAPDPAEAPAEAAEAPQPDLAPGWTQVAIESAEGRAAEALGRARAAQGALATRLMQKLQGAVGEGDFAKGVEVCKNAAPEIAESVSEGEGVELGRTSFRVRNPENRPRPFAEPIVEARYAEPVLMQGPDGGFAYMAPVKLGEVCVKCHGSEAQIPEQVKTILAEQYPEDEATGFAPGDLRGWFWVQVSPEAKL